MCNLRWRWVFIILVVVLTACSSGGSDDNAADDDTSDASKNGRKWDSMVWDQGKWS